VDLVQNPLSTLLPRFLARYPQVRLLVHASNRRVDVLNENFDVAVRVRTQPSGEDGLVMRRFGPIRELLVASRDYLERAGRPQRPEELAAHATLAFAPETDSQTWELIGPGAQTARIQHHPRLVCHDFLALRQAALSGLGIALLPEMRMREDLEDGRLERVLGEWDLPQGLLHLVFPSRRGLLPAVRAFLDFLAEHLPRTCTEAAVRATSSVAERSAPESPGR